MTIKQGSAVSELNSVPAVFQANVEKFGDADCVYYKKDGQYTSLSWNQMGDMIRKMSCFLLGRGIKKKDKIGIFSDNRYEWWIADIASLSIGAVDVPIYATDSAEEALYILKNSDTGICFVGTEEHLDRVLSIKKELPNLRLIITFDEMLSKKRGILSFSQAIEEGALYKKPDDFNKRMAKVTREDLATIIYTSGTTGLPKGVMLSHGNFLSNMDQSIGHFESYLSSKDTFLSILPLSHALERTTGFYSAMKLGVPVSFVENISSTLLEDLIKVRPTVLVSVPRIFEKIHAAILSKVSYASSLKRAVFGWALRTAIKNIPYNCNDRQRKGMFALRYSVADSLVFSRLKRAVGFDNLNFVVSGGGSLSISDAEFFLGMDIKICEGYGLTEASPVTHANKPQFIKRGTVGQPVKDTMAKISDDGEILIKGPQVMMGYYKDKAGTKETFTGDGFLKTGDKGVIDEEGFLTITGRIKDIIVTAGGKNISPQIIEGRLNGSLFIEHVALIGDRRKYLSALIVPNFAELKKWAEKNDVAASSNSEFINNAKVAALFDAEIKNYMKSFARVEQIRRFTLLADEWSQQTGELTPSLKVKRHVIEEKYAAQIKEMYKD